jgi:hypothetical protein
LLLKKRNDYFSAVELTYYPTTAKLHFSMKELLEERLKVRLYNIDGTREIAEADLTINNNHAILRIDGSSELGSGNDFTAVLPNGKILLLIDCEAITYHSAAFLHYKEFRVFEVIDLEKDKWSDKLNTIQCNIPVLAEWFNRAFYKVKQSNESFTVEVRPEKVLTIEVAHGRLLLIQDSVYRSNTGVQITPRFFLKLDFNDPLLRKLAMFEFKKVIDFFQFCFTRTLHKSSLFFRCGDGVAFALSEIFPFKLEGTEDSFTSNLVPFKDIENDLHILIGNWEKKYDRLKIVNELLLDAVENPVMTNRFLSVMRALEMLAKFETIKLSKEEEDWQNELRKYDEETVARWFIHLLHSHRPIFKTPSKTWPISIISTRNYLTHRIKKGQYVFHGPCIQHATNCLYGLAKAVVAYEIGMSFELCKALGRHHDFHYHNMFIPSEHSSFKETGI